MTTEKSVDINSITEPRFIQIYTRPSTDVKWMWEETKYHWPHIDSVYRDTGKFRSEIEESEDGLTVAVSFFFNSEESFQEWKSDEYLKSVGKYRDNYNLEHGIERIL